GACAGVGDEEEGGPAVADPHLPGDVANAVDSLPEAEIVQRGADGVPTMVRGDIARVSDLSAMADRASAEKAVGASIGPALAAFRLKTSDVKLRRMTSDVQGNRHLRYNQVFNGLDVIGGDLVVHMDIKGAIYAMNGSARGDIPQTLGAHDIGADAA